MVSNVRLKAYQRLVNVLDYIKREAAPGGHVRESIVIARTDPEVAGAVRSLYRGVVADAFPGARVEFGQRYVRVHLPSLYPNSHIPIMAALSPIHTEVFNPKGAVSE